MKSRATVFLMIPDTKKTGVKMKKKISIFWGLN